MVYRKHAFFPFFYVIGSYLAHLPKDWPEAPKHCKRDYAWSHPTQICRYDSQRWLQTLKERASPKIPFCKFKSLHGDLFTSCFCRLRDVYGEHTELLKQTEQINAQINLRQGQYLGNVFIADSFHLPSSLLPSSLFNKYPPKTKAL